MAGSAASGSVADVMVLKSLSGLARGAHIRDHDILAILSY